jgi:membrane protein DedA with SNARE-associated domain
MVGLNSHTLATLLGTYGCWVVFLLVAVESIGIPVPGETVLLLASVYASTTHRLSVALVILAAAMGAILGDNIGYLVGREGGYRLIHRYGRYVRLDARKLRLGEHLFHTHGGKVVFFGRFVPVLRIWAAFLAGTTRMSWRRFLLCNAGGGVVWAVVMGSLAASVGSTALRLGGSAGLGLGLLATVVMGIMALVLRRSEQRLQDDADLAQAEMDALAA